VPTMSKFLDDVGAGLRGVIEYPTHVVDAVETLGAQALSIPQKALDDLGKVLQMLPLILVGGVALVVVVSILK